jgi:hypothetical protein
LWANTSRTAGAKTRSPFFSVDMTTFCAVMIEKKENTNSGVCWSEVVCPFFTPNGDWDAYPTRFSAICAQCRFALGAAGLGANVTRALAQQKLTQDDLLKFDSKGR